MTINRNDLIDKLSDIQKHSSCLRFGQRLALGQAINFIKNAATAPGIETDSEKLLPCPFCGSEAKIIQVHGEYLVQCTRVGVCYGRINDKSSEGYTYKKDAVDLWNKRHIPAPIQDIASKTGWSEEDANAMAKYIREQS